MRRYVNLNRAQMLALLAQGASPAHAECAEAVRRGATFRVHSDTVTRDSVLQIYALRSQSAALDGTPTIGTEQALKDLAASSYQRIRLAAVSAGWDFAMFMDPECVDLIACLGVEGRGVRY